MATATVAATPFSSPAAQQASLHAQSAQFSAARQRLLGRFGASQDGGDPLLTGSAQLAVSAVSPQRPASGVWTRGALTGASGVGSMYTNGLGVESVVGGARSVMGMSALRVSKYEAAASRAGDGAHAVATSTSTSMPMRNGYSAAIRATSPVHRMRRTSGGGGQEQSLTPEQKLSNTRVEHERMLARLSELPPHGPVGGSSQVSALRAQLSASQQVLHRAPIVVPPPAPIVRSRKLSKSTNAVSFANAPTREDDGKDAIIRHLRSDNERLEKLVVEAVNASEEVATKAVEEQQVEIDQLRAENQRLLDQVDALKAELANERRNVRFAVSKLSRMRSRSHAVKPRTRRFSIGT